MRDFLDFMWHDWREEHPIDFWVRCATLLLLTVAFFYLAIPAFERTWLS